MTDAPVDVLSMLGYPGLETEEDFDVLELLLACIQPENILSPEEREILEDADLSCVGNEVETFVLEGLKSNGIEEEDVNMDTSDREYIENKLNCMEPFIWDPKIDMLRKQKNKMEKVLAELNKKFFGLESYIQDSEKEWTKIKSCFDLLYEDLYELESCSKNPENTVEFQSFLDSHKNDLEKFVEVSNRCLNRIQGIKVNLDVSSTVHVKGLQLPLEYSENLCALQPRLACAFYNINCKYANSTLKLFMAGCERKSSSSEIESVSDEYFVSVFNLCDKWAELYLKEKIILLKLNENKTSRELYLEMCNNLQPILNKQLAHQLLTSIIVHLWVHEQNGTTELLQSTCEHFEEELSNVLSRVCYLEEVQKKLISYFDSEDYKVSLLEKLKKISGSILSDTDKCIAKKIEEKEEQLLSLLQQQNIVLQNGKKQVSNTEEKIEQMRRSINSHMRIVSQFEEGYNESLNQLQLKKNNMIEVTEQLVENPIYCKSRLLWVYFLTDHEKLHNFKAFSDLESPTNINEMSFLTSTPKSFMGT